MAIKYIAYNEAGEIVSGVLEVESRERAQETLMASNLVVLNLKKQRRRPTAAELMPTLFGVKTGDVITFTSELASLLDSGIALLPSLRVLYEQVEKRALKDALLLIIREIEEGNSLSQACAGQPTVFPSFYTRLLQVAEETGELKQILLEVVSYMQKQKVVIEKVKKALTYPAIVLAVGLVAAFVLTAVALPAMTGLLVEYGAEIPLSTRMLVSAGTFTQAYGPHTLAAVAVLFLLGWQYRRTAAGKKRVDGIILRLPVIGKLIQQSQMARLCSSFTTLLNGGLSTTETIKFTIEATENSVFREALSRVYREVLTGSRLEPAISKQRVYPRLFSQTVGIGEESGNLRMNLAGLATFYEQETDRTISRATDMIEPTMIIFIGIMVGFIGIAIMSAIYSIIPQIS